MHPRQRLPPTVSEYQSRGLDSRHFLTPATTQVSAERLQALLAVPRVRPAPSTVPPSVSRLFASRGEAWTVRLADVAAVTLAQVRASAALPGAPEGWATLASDFSSHPLVREAPPPCQSALLVQGLLAWLGDRGCTVEDLPRHYVPFPLQPLWHEERLRPEDIVDGGSLATLIPIPTLLGFANSAWDPSESGA